MFSPRFLVVSLGNPLPKYESLHSAGHFVLNGLTKALRQPAFREIPIGKHNCLVSTGPKYTLIQSPTLMNVSGGFVAAAWKQMVGQHDAAMCSLVIVHDELELAFGQVKLRPWDRSPKGHNGIKSVKNSISEKSFPQSPLVRIAVGIGRPEERDAATVSRYVLAKMPAAQREALEGEVSWRVSASLVELEEEWRGELPTA